MKITNNVVIMRFELRRKKYLILETYRQAPALKQSAKLQKIF